MMGAIKDFRCWTDMMKLGEMDISGINDGVTKHNNIVLNQVDKIEHHHVIINNIVNFINSIHCHFHLTLNG